MSRSNETNNIISEDRTVRKKDAAPVVQKEETPLVNQFEPEDRVIWQKPELVIRKLGDIKGKTIVDIGAGTGYFTFRLARSGAKVIAVDIDPQAIEWMENQKERYSEEIKNNVDIRLASFSDPNLNNQEADVALMVNTYIYIENRITYLKNLQRGLKKGAKLVIVDFKKKTTAIGPELSQRISLLDVENELTEAGFTILNEDDTSLEYQYFVSAVYNPN